jgi:multidrug resistance efflux pump
MRFDVFTAKLESAKAALATAEADLGAAMGEIRAAPRWEKVRISEVLETAFDDLRRAKADLARIESMIAEGS